MNTQQLKELAQRTTPCPWKWFTSNSHNRLSSVPSGRDGDVISAFNAADGVPCVSVSRDDMAYIEAAHPGAVIALIDRLEAAERECDMLITQLSIATERAGISFDRAQAAEAELARLKAAAGQPVAWAHRLINKHTATEHPWVYGSAEKTRSEGDVFLVEVMPLYTAAQPAVVPPEKIIEIMQSAWNEFCDDTGCYPDDFEYQNEQLFFDAGRWAMLVAERISILGAQPQKVVELPTQSEYEDPLSAYEALEHVKAALDAAGVKWVQK